MMNTEYWSPQRMTIEVLKLQCSVKTCIFFFVSFHILILAPSLSKKVLTSVTKIYCVDILCVVDVVGFCVCFGFVAVLNRKCDFFFGIKFRN